MMIFAACALVASGCGYDDSELTRNIDAIDRNFQPWKRQLLK